MITYNMQMTEYRSNGAFVDPIWYRVLGLAHKAFAEIEPSERKTKYEKAVEYLKLFIKTAKVIDKEDHMVIRKTILVLESRLEKIN